MAETATMTPKARPGNLKLVTAPTGKAPADLTSTEAGAVFEWAEGLRDAHQKKGELLTARGILSYVRNGIKNEENQKAVRVAVKKIYKEELAASEPAAAKPSAKAVKKGKKKAEAKPSKNGKPKAAKAERTAPVESTVELDTTVKGVPVYCSVSDTGRRRPKVGGMPAREVLRWMGSKGFDVPGATKVMNTLFAGLKDEAYVTGFCVEGHVGSGRKGKDGAFGEFGSPDKDVAKALLAMKK